MCNIGPTSYLIELYKVPITVIVATKAPVEIPAIAGQSKGTRIKNLDLISLSPREHVKAAFHMLVDSIDAIESRVLVMIYDNIFVWVCASQLCY